MDQIVQVLGSLLILTAFVAAQRGSLSTESRLYLTLNLVGAGVLAVLAAHERQFGFLLLEFSWALVAAISLAEAVRRAGSAAASGKPHKGQRPDLTDASAPPPQPPRAARQPSPPSGRP